MKGKSIEFKSSKEKHDYLSYDDLNNKDITIIAKNFRKFIVKRKIIDIAKKVNDFIKIYLDYIVKR